MSNILLFPLKVFLIALDFLIMALTFGWLSALKKFFAPAPLRSVPVDDSTPSHRVHSKYKNNPLTTPDPSIATCYDLQKKSFTKYASNPCMGTREFLGQHTPEIKKFGDVTWKTYENVGNSSHKFGAALRKAGLVPSPLKASLERLKTPCALAIFENTCQEWMTSALGCFSQSIIVTTIYATLGMNAVVEAINDGMIRAIVCNYTNVEALVEKKKEMPSLKTIIYTGDMVAKGAKMDVPKVDGLEIVYFDDFVESGDVKAFPPTPPTPASTAVIMYTSGSTGKPKGVIIRHSNIVASVACGNQELDLDEGKETYLAYLPLAHIMELFVELAQVSIGAKICYADPKTLTATGAYPIGALEQYAPTLMIGVPKIWDIIKKGVEAKIAASPTIARFLVETAFEARGFAISMGWDTPLFKALVFKKFSKVVGGNLKMAASGGGPLNADVQRFIRTCFGMPFIQGYGLTESTGLLAVQAVDDLRPGICGVPSPCMEIKLVSTPEINDKAGLPYLNTDTKDSEGNTVYGRGEILAKGTSISFGYYDMPEKTKEDFDAEGYFHTGDIGQFTEDGSIRIVDRKKNLVKLKGGEYIAVENMEMAYGSSKYVDSKTGGICCYGDGDMDRPVAMMQLNIADVKKWMQDKDVQGDLDSVKKSKELNEEVLNDLKKEGKKAGLSRLEKIVAVVFIDEPWTPENGCLTAANKLNRRVVVEKHSKEFNEVKKKGIF